MKLRRYLDPRIPWRETSEVDKVRVYTRQSFVAIAVLVAIAAVTDSVAEDRWVAVGAMVVSTAGAVVAVLGMPQFGGTARGYVRVAVGIAVAAAGVAAATGSAPTALWALVVVAIPLTAAVPLRWSVIASLVLGAGSAAAGFGAVGAVAAFAVTAFMAMTVQLSMWLLRTVTELDLARHTASALSVAEERLRFSRDLHDVVGRSLSAIAVKSELAAALSRRGDDRAAAQMDEVSELARESMTEARQLVRGYQSIDLITEIDGARSLLNAAGISTDVTGRVEEVRAEHAEAAAWVVREGATNVLRHSDATCIRIDLSDRAVTMRNDRPHASTSTDGTGISSLRERLATVGGTVDTVRSADEFTLTATFPATVSS
ncbi:sensor histidine kinase [Rhodococcoides yunnanense]|uniref:sensor histidine kinase n=1 Tax=Rhodococcoides yunnanense TaxID=278209 RepID=UPI000932B671|nr:histidine kinase [Rhodococcus yunnanensis]